MILEHVRRLNDVVINADQDHVVLVHGTLPPEDALTVWTTV
jgi:hypothetical protein